MERLSLQNFYRWTFTGRALVFVLAASSIWCLLAEMYGLCSMQTFTFFVSVPALALLAGLAAADRARGDGRLWRAVVMGGMAGLVAALAYDLFRVPFVFAGDLGIASILPQMPLFKVFPRFGAMILGQATEQKQYSMAAQVVGWAYHFSNGATFGMMYAAMIGAAARRNWLWAVVMAVGLELAMLFTPYPQFFGIKVGTAFVVVTLTAHLIFGVTLGLMFRRYSAKAVSRIDEAALRRE
jgi:hypothetical protein